MSGISHPMVRRSGRSMVAKVAGDNGDSSAPSRTPRSIVGSDDLTLMESDADRTSVSSAAADKRSESSEEQPACATVPPQSELGAPGGGLGLALAVSHVEPEPPQPEHFSILGYSLISLTSSVDLNHHFMLSSLYIISIQA